MATAGDPRRGRRRALALGLLVGVVVLGALALVLVGGGGGCSASGYPGSPDCVAREYVTRTDASKCDFVAPAVLEEITGEQGAAARRVCARAAERASAPEDVEILERETVGDQVIVEIKTDGREGKLTLGRSGGRWQITSFAE